MEKHKSETVLDYIEFARSHDITAHGRLTKNSIEKQVNYSTRHFDRIFKDYSKFTPLEFAERVRLLSCVESIRNGNTLIETALNYDFTPEGLSNAIRTKLNLNVMKIKNEGFEIEKHLKISNSMVQLDQYKYQIEKEMYFAYIEALDEENILTKITSQSSDPDLEKAFEIHFDYKKVAQIISKYDGYKIDYKTYEDQNLQESIIIYVLLKKEYDSGNNQFEMSISELVSLIFSIGFFFNIETINLKNGNYKMTIKEDLKIILESLKEIEEVTNESFDITLQSNVKGNVVITQFSPILKEMMRMVNDPSE